MGGEDSPADDWIDELDRQLGHHANSAAVFGDDLRKRLKEDPEAAIGTIRETLDRGLDDAYGTEEQRGLAEAYGGGPFEAVPRTVYNAVGAVYPYLRREHKDAALEEVFGELDRVNYGTVQQRHTNGIHEPELVADIAVARPLYWPGLGEAEQIAEEFDDFSGVEAGLMEDGRFDPRKVDSEFLVTYGLLRTDYTDYGEQLVMALDQEFLERTLEGIVALRFGLFAYEDMTERHLPLTAEEQEQGMNRLREVLPDSLHAGVETLADTAEWVDPVKFDSQLQQKPSEKDGPGTAYVLDLIREHDDGAGADWDSLADHIMEEGHTPKDLEKTVNELVDDGTVYEPVLGHLKIDQSVVDNE